MRMRLVFYSAAAAAMACPPASTAAADSDFSPKETRRITYDYAKCVVDRHAAVASTALLSDADNETLTRRYSALIDGDCLARTVRMTAKMSFSGDLYRYALADALVGREFAASPVPDFSNVPPLQRRTAPEAPAPLPTNASKSQKSQYERALKDFNEAQSVRVLSEYGECVVRADPAVSRGLLLTQPDTPAETSSFTALRPALGQCLPEGVTLSFGRMVLRGTIAVNYYRLAHAVRPDPTQ